MKTCEKCGGDMMRQGPKMHLETCRDRLAAQLATAVEALRVVELGGVALDAGVDVGGAWTHCRRVARQALAAISATGGKEAR